jgi:hypothetical protein
MDSSDDRFGQHSRRNVLSAAGGLAGLSMLGVTGQTAQAQTTGERPPVAITASPATTGAGNATYTITVQNVAAQNGQSNVDQVALDFGGVGMNFNAVSRTDVTAIKNPGTAAERQLVVTQTRTSLSGDWPTIGISRASGQPAVSEGDTLQIRISGVANPRVSGRHNIGVQLNELATGQRAGLLDSRTGSFTITDNTGSVSATVTSGGEPVAAETMFTDGGGHVLGTVTPDDAGAVTIEDVVPSTYDITASPSGFEEKTVTGVAVEPDQVAEDIEFQPAPEPTAVEVETTVVGDAVSLGDPIQCCVDITNRGAESGGRRRRRRLRSSSSRLTATSSQSRLRTSRSTPASEPQFRRRSRRTNSTRTSIRFAPRLTTTPPQSSSPSSRSRTQSR